MRKIKLLVMLFFVGLAIFGLAHSNRFAPTVIAFSSGPPARTTGAPGETTCASCHSGGGSGSGQFTIAAPPRYIPGQTYQIQVRHTTADMSRRRWGFQLTSLAGNTAAGSFANLANTTNNYSSGGRIYIQHTSAGTFSTKPAARSGLLIGRLRLLAPERLHFTLPVIKPTAMGERAATRFTLRIRRFSRLKTYSILTATARRTSLFSATACGICSAANWDSPPWVGALLPIKSRPPILTATGKLI